MGNRWEPLSLAEAQNAYGPLGFEIVQEIGSGGYKQVFRAVYKAQPVAFKVLHNVEDVNIDIRRRKEVTLMQEIASPHVAKIFGFNFGGDSYEAYLAEEFIDGPSLESLISEGSVTIELTLQIMDNIFRALGECAKRQIVHRDIKPENILLREDGNAVLTDFGLARKMEDSPITESGGIVGTLHYAPPECILYQRDLVDEKSDLFSLGIMSYYLLSGHHPFSGRVDGKAGIDDMLHKEAEPLIDVQHEVGQELSDFVMRLIRRDISERYPTVERAYKKFKKAVKTK